MHDSRHVQLCCAYCAIFHIISLLLLYYLCIVSISSCTVFGLLSHYLNIIFILFVIFSYHYTTPISLTSPHITFPSPSYLYLHISTSSCLPAVCERCFKYNIIQHSAARCNTMPFWLAGWRVGGRVSGRAGERANG